MYALIQAARNPDGPEYFLDISSVEKRPFFENVPLSLSHIVLSLILQAHCQRCLCAHPRGDGTAEGPGIHQPLAVRRQLPKRRQPDPQSARQNQVRGGRGRGRVTEGDFEFLMSFTPASNTTTERASKQ